VDNLTPTELENLNRLFQHLARLSSYAAGLKQRAWEIILISLALQNEGVEFVSVAEILKAAAQEVATSATAVNQAITDAVARLSDNPSAADIAEVVAALNAAKATNEASLAAAALIDPNDPGGGVIVDPEDPGEVVDPNV